MNWQQTKAVILAGGAGTRVQHLLPGIPKPMAPVAGKPFLEWVVRFLAKQGLRDVTISSGYRAEQIAAHFDSLALPGISVRCVSEPQPMGTAGGFRQAIAKRLDEPGPWLVCNGDSLVLADLAPMLALLTSDPALEAVFLGVEVQDCARFGSLETDASGRLLGFVEKRPGTGLINAGVYLFAHALPLRLPANQTLSFETDVFPALLASGVPMGVRAVTAPFLDIGSEATLGLADEFITRHKNSFL
ncbi:MAG: sugar phosphate nucleotidyltransferase [Candidatus Solibacter sp.]